MHLRFALVALMALVIASPALDAVAKPKSKSQAAPKRKRAMPYHLKALKKRPKGEKLAGTDPSPSCSSEEDESDKGPFTIHFAKRTLSVDLGPKINNMTVSEHGKPLWSKYIGSAGGVDASTVCVSQGWGVVIAGHYRHGYDVYDVLTGKKLGPGDVAVYSPDLSWALVPPSVQWATSSFQVSRTYRIMLDGSKPPYPLDTPPVARDEEHGHQDAPQVAISPDGKRYAIVSSKELALYSAKTDQKIARLARPAISDDQRDRNDTTLSFSASGRYLVVEHEEPREAHWYRIDRARK
ncbi:MAG: hypothetical protein U0271_38945 [Polyangiaceae bacterium]